MNFTSLAEAQTITQTFYILLMGAVRLSGRREPYGRTRIGASAVCLGVKKTRSGGKA